MNRPLLILLFGGLVLIAAFLLSRGYNDDRDGDKAPVAAAPSQPDAPAPGAPESERAGPAFDIVRINPQGEAVIAGKASPLSRVTILAGEREIGVVTADPRGEWVFVPEDPLPSGPQQLVLREETADGKTIHGDAPVIITIPEQAESPALAVRIGSDGALDVMQGPDGEKREAALSITGLYHGQGRISVTGANAAPNSALRLYLDDERLADASADDNGVWRATAPLPSSLSKGEHRLRADSIDPSGKVLARAEISFDPEQEASPDPRPLSITVKKGDSLWRIARAALGSGFDYVLIYKANKNQIRDPDLIYPGQVFTLPAQ